MEYRAKSDHKKVVKITKEDDAFVWFMMNGIEIAVAKKRFYKVYEEIK